MQQKFAAEIQKFTKARFSVPPLRRGVPALPAFSHCRRIGGLELPLISWIFCANGSKRLEKTNALIYNDKGLTKFVFALHPPGNKK